MVKSDKEYEKLARSILDISEDLQARSKIYKLAFVKGIFYGLGGILGATLLLGAITWVLSFFDEVPLLGRLIDVITTTVNSR